MIYKAARQQRGQQGQKLAAARARVAARGAGAARARRWQRCAEHALLAHKQMVAQTALLARQSRFGLHSAALCRLVVRIQVSVHRSVKQFFCKLLAVRGILRLTPKRASSHLVQAPNDGSDDCNLLASFPHAHTAISKRLTRLRSRTAHLRQTRCTCSSSRNAVSGMPEQPSAARVSAPLARCAHTHLATTSPAYNAALPC